MLSSTFDLIAKISYLSFVVYKQRWNNDLVISYLMLNGIMTFYEKLKNIQDVRHVTAFCIFICLGINTLSEVICTEIGKNDYQMYDTSNHHLSKVLTACKF